MFLPPLSMCPMDFIQDILAGRVRVLHNFEVTPIKVPFAQTITKKLVLEKVQDHPTFKKYMPRDPGRHCSKQWLFDLVATLDPAFFPALVKEVEDGRKQKVKKPEPTIEVTREMLELID